MFGVTKALTNYFAGRFSDRFGRKVVLIAGWLVAAPVPFALMWAPSWSWILAANVLLGVSQGLTWSTTVIMKIDLAGPKNRGLAMGLNEFAGYFAVALSALGTGFIAARYGLRPEPFLLGVAFVALGLALSVLLVRETRHHVTAESLLAGELPPEGVPTAREVFWRTSVLDRNLSSLSQAGLVNNLNDARDDESLAADALGPGAGDELPEPPHGRVDRDEGPDLGGDGLGVVPPPPASVGPIRRSSPGSSADEGEEPWSVRE